MDAIVADIGERLGYPVILRSPGSHMSSHSLLVSAPKAACLPGNGQEVHQALAEARWPEFYAIEFVDFRKSEGWYRKIRPAIVGEEIGGSSGGVCSEWVTSGWRSRKPGIEFYRANSEALQKTRAFLEDPEVELGTAGLDTLRNIRERIPLDIFGVDFDIDDAVQMVFFEASAAMIFPHLTNRVPPDLWMPEEPLERIHAAFHGLVARRIAEGARWPS